MNYLVYVAAAYTLFVSVLAIDAIGSRLRLHWARRTALRSQQRRQARSAVGSQAQVPLELDR